MDETLLGKCGFYCGSCPTYLRGTCAGCVAAHEPGDCFTRDCALRQGIPVESEEALQRLLEDLGG